MSNTPTKEEQLFAHLATFDTPTICNAIEIAGGGRRESGFTRKMMVPALPGASAFVGRAVTATISATERGEEVSTLTRRMEYYRYVAKRGAVVVIEDLDDPAGLGAFWGEVHSNVHAALGIAGVVTSGSVRDLDMLNPSLQIIAGCVSPSHAFVDVETIDKEVTIHAMKVAPGNIVHADRHGAVVIPDELVAKIPEAIELMLKRESVIIKATQQEDFDVAKLEEALRHSSDIH